MWRRSFRARALLRLLGRTHVWGNPCVRVGVDARRRGVSVRKLRAVDLGQTGNAEGGVPCGGWGGMVIAGNATTLGGVTYTAQDVRFLPSPQVSADVQMSCDLRLCSTATLARRSVFAVYACVRIRG